MNGSSEHRDDQASHCTKELDSSFSAEEWRLDSALHHVRFASLSGEAVSLYMVLWRAQNSVGHVDPAPALDAIQRTAGGSKALKELERHDLVSTEPHRAGLWIVHPDTLDGAEAFANGKVP